MLRWIWVAIAVVSGLPIAYVGFLLNPLVFFGLGSDRWQEQMVRLRPFRWQIGFLVAVCAFSIAMVALG